MDKQQNDTASSVILERSRPSYFTRLFTGRMNRQNYILGSTFFVLLPLICFLVVLFHILLSPSLFAMPYLDPTNLNTIVTPQISIVSLLETPTNAIWSAIGLIFIIISLPYLFSLQIKRLHDLNLSGWLWTINIMPLASLFVLPVPGTTPNPVLFGAVNMVSLAASFFSFYVSFWPGTKGVNKFGEKPLPRSNLLGDILQLR